VRKRAVEPWASQRGDENLLELFGVHKIPWIGRDVNLEFHEALNALTTRNNQISPRNNGY
jgi:hypothetical protein